MKKITKLSYVPFAIDLDSQPASLSINPDTRAVLFGPVVLDPEKHPQFSVRRAGRTLGSFFFDARHDMVLEIECAGAVYAVGVMEDEKAIKEWAADANAFLARSSA